MRYIKTKDGRILDLDSKRISSYEIVDDKIAVEEYGEEKGFICIYYFDEDEGEHLECDSNGGRSMDNWYLDDIIAQAGSLEEIFDAFVSVDDDGKCHFMSKTVYRAFERKLPEDNLYGAIWTIGDHGEPILKSVAKLKGKRKWELL